MKYVIAFVLVACVFIAYCSASRQEEIMSALEALDAAKQELLSQLDNEVESDSQWWIFGNQRTPTTRTPTTRTPTTRTPTTRTPSRSSTQKCVNTDTLNVRNSNAQRVGTVRRGDRVTLTGNSRTMNGLRYVEIGSNRYVAESYLSTCSSLSTPTPPPTGSSSGFTKDTMRRYFNRLSSSKIDEFYPHLVAAMNEGQINNCYRRSAFLAQLAHESGGLQWWEEFASGQAYEGRRDLGNTQPGDGRRFKGRGPIQLTGRANYRDAGRALGLPLESNPEMAKRTDVGFRTAVWFWTTRGLNRYCDGTQANFDVITRRVNGGYNGKADRDQYFRKGKQLMGC